MRLNRLQPLGVLALVTCAAAVHAAGSGLGLKLDRALQAPALGDEKLPIFIDAEQLRGHQERDFEALGDARFRTRGKAVFADWLYYRSDLDEVEAAGNVRMENRGDVFTGTRLKLNLETERGYLQQPTYRLAEQNARGDAREFLFVGENRYRVDQGRYTTCGPGQDDWFIRARDLDLNKNTDIGTARDASVVFMDRTILYTPWMNFPLSANRKSGFLSPTIATSGKSGAEFSIPYYWNIAPNRDATFTPHVLAKRGFMLGSEFRYLERGYNGEVRLEVLPDDDVAQGKDRYATFMRHQQVLGPWTLLLNAQKVSDDNYFRDLSTQIQATSLVLLPREAIAVRSGALGSSGIWSFTGMMQRWQTLQDPRAPIAPPYDRLPQLLLSTQNYDILGTDIAFTSSYVDFHHPTLLTGRRTVAYPSLSVPLQNPFAFITPKIGVHHTRYDVDPSPRTVVADASRTVPIFSTEGGLVFERDTTIRGTEYLQTLEPRLLYVYIPFRKQNHLPNFESGLTDINFATIFSENQFSGSDRINDANQLTAGITSRLLDPNTGIEQLRVGLAQRFYFKDQEVTLPGVPTRTSTASDILAALSGRITRDVIAEVGVQYNTEFSETRKLAFGARYQPDVGKVLNASYRMTRGILENVDMSAQWPITGGWSGVGRVNYSLRDSRIAEGLAGVEYNGGCWVVRFVSYTVAVGTGDASRSVFLQLELNGVARVGSNPLDVLRQNISGYTKINEPQGSILPPLRQ
ncbi:MAG: LPS-assembly protein LptD [Burkholderiales bacterium]|nr:LPS-assembly protein LptD [Burkholderiales bacterium]